MACINGRLIWCIFITLKYKYIFCMKFTIKKYSETVTFIKM